MRDKDFRLPEVGARVRVRRGNCDDGFARLCLMAEARPQPQRRPNAQSCTEQNSG